MCGSRFGPGTFHTCPAEELEALLAENKRLREALEKIEIIYDTENDRDGIVECLRVAREALRKESEG